MKLKLYGIMGSINGGSSDLGKNTTCLHICDGENELLIDSGTGILNYFEETNSLNHSILYTHYHLDHILGFPFINQLFDDNATFNLYGPKLNGYQLKDALKSLFVEPLLPIKYESIKKNINYNNIEENEIILINNFVVEGLHVFHPGGSMVYSVKSNNKKICILTDLPNNLEKNKALLEFCENSDILYVDSYFLDSELSEIENNTFGHASVESAIKIKRNSHSKVLILGHHKFTRKYSELTIYKKEDIIIGRDGFTIEI